MSLSGKAAVALLAAALVLGPLACGGSKRVRRLQRQEIQQRLRRLETPGLVIGEFTLDDHAVVDGDTIRVAGLRTTLRLLAIDTEETFKSEADRRLYEMGFDKYLQAKQGPSPRPVKAATPLGEAAKHFAEKFFAGVRTVRLERDHPKDIRGRYGRYLAYVFARKQGRWVNYNLECVRAGMSPYFTKYSYSRRFHDQFVAAQRQAQQARRGIWDPRREHYRDYPERLEWWNARAEFIWRFEQEAMGRDNYITLTHWDAVRRLERHLDREVVLLGLVGEIKLGDKGPTKVMLSRRIGSDFPLVFFDKDVFGSSGIGGYRGEFVIVRGIVSKWHNRWRHRDELQIVVNTPGQITVSKMVPNYSGWDTEGEVERAEVEAERQHWRELLQQQQDKVEQEAQP
ncbi:MAG: hypothetical protein DRI34_13625 [Deltaproteobacteria bacterium]|nr:MAG: hypothetical protein DRI34_13625 [Deltaproteobacteria bacterium]